jgi:riboflavin kinase / FMN adenylyltransferase
MRKSVLTLGSFDGLHRGHQAILKRVVARARVQHARSVVLAFGVPPRHAGEALSKPVLLTTLNEKAHLMKRRGIQVLETLVFDRKTANTSPEDFFKKTIAGRYHAVEMIVGPRVAFGKNRAGRLRLLKELGRHYRVRIGVVQPVGQGRLSVSSRKIRALLYRGFVDQANALLGYPYSVEGTVMHGDRRGRHLGFPTANLFVDPRKILPRGVFWVKVLPAASQIPLDRQEAYRGWDGLCNVGTRPTFTPGSHELHCETFLMRGPRRLYGKKLRVVFMKRIRAERRFKSARALQQQIAKDLKRVRRWINA